MASNLSLEDIKNEQIDLENIPVEEVFQQLKCSKEGLSSAEGQKRIGIFGPNKLEEKKENKLLKFLGFMWNPLSWVMECAAIMAIVLANGGGKPPDWPDFVGITVLLIINSTISFIEENSAGNAASALMANFAPKTKILRDGKWSEEEASILVPGDIISIKLGDIVPADARLLEGDPLKVDQAALTGESLPATKFPGAEVFSGSTVKQGEIEAIVIATGVHTFFGKAAHLVDSTNNVGHFQKVLTAIGNFCICSIAVGMVIEIVVMYPNSLLYKLLLKCFDYTVYTFLSKAKRITKFAKDIMEAQLHRPQDTGLHSGEGHGQVHDEGEQVHDEGEHHHKQSVLKKVKAKAKKIKDHLKHGLGHEHGHEHEHEQHSQEETDEEEMEEGAEVHGGPYAIRSKDIPKEEVVSMGNLENPTSPKEDRYDSKMKNEDVHRPILQRQDEFARPPGFHFPEERTKGIDDYVSSVGKHEHQGLGTAPIGGVDHHTAAETKGFDHHATAPGTQGHQGLQGHENIIGAPIGLVDHHAAASHRPITTAAETHETKGFDHRVTAPGAQGHQGLQGTENIIGAPTGLANPHASHLHVQMHMPPVVTDTGARGRGELNDQGLQGHKFKVLTGLEEDPNVPKDYPNPTNYQSKVTDPTGANNEEAGVSPLVQSFEKMGVNDVPEATRMRTEPKAGDFQFDQGTERRQYTGSRDQFAPQESPTVFPSVREDTESIPKSMNPSNPQDLPQDTLTGKPGSYTGTLSSATSAIADKAVAAKNIVASKLGYGGTEEETWVTGGDATKTTSATEYAQKAASTVAEKLAPVYEKVASAGSTVMAKVTGHENRGGVDAEHEVRTDKGVSMTEYLAEKLKPGEEDRALSEVISDSLSRQKEKTEEAKPMGKVTESVEVERRLGPIEPKKKEEVVGSSGETKVDENLGQGVMDRVKGAVSTWLGKGAEAQANDSAASGGAVVGGGVE